MPPKIYHMEQGSDEWHMIRLGKITASVAKKLVTNNGVIRDNDTVREMARTIAAQRINGFGEAHVSTREMERGHLQEPLARDIYSDKYAEVTEVGFIENTFDGVVLGASPDGLVGEKGGIEIKSRLGKFQIETILADKVPAEYMMQIQFSMLVCERLWWDFVQYSNGMHLYVKRIMSDSAMQSVILDAAMAFEDRVNEIIVNYENKSSGLFKAAYVDLDMLKENELEEAGL